MNCLWEQIFSKKEWGKYPSESIIRFIARNFYNVQDRSKINILELGFGTGSNLWFCAKEGFSVSGIEWSKTGAQRFEARMKDENLSDKIKQIEIGDYIDKLDNFEDESFDAIIDVASLCCNDREKSKNIFKKAMKKLKNGGKFYSSALSKQIFGYEANKNDFFEPTNGIYVKMGPLRFDDEKSLKELYKELKCINFYTQTLKNNEIINDEILIFEGEKSPTGWGIIKNQVLENE
ncbi:class I SAM-dependent methyltransferase [Campylobacter insulaenigrae]|uniref:SAM-dependent methyltransferase n=1 Tax=Campylobacter insulaenigrae TaxID=260714 RepID=UPI00215232E5|nr:class I SAM-dependent methyltransferase [Campylobacter insulaenigrae]MCR6583490.1 class I SAM-dependent methyltransferase [Campylobacter insulaenigrae]